MSTIHASAVLVGRRAVLFRGPAGTGKSRLAWQLVQATGKGVLPFGRLVGDDRLHVEARNGRLLARAPSSLAGLIEIRGIGIRRLAHEPVAVVGLVVDLAAADAERHPSRDACDVEVAGIRLPRLAVAAGIDPLFQVLALLTTEAAGN